MKIHRITLEDMLAARDRRAEIQRSMLGREAGICLVCLTLNIAGDIKRTPMTRMLFARGMKEFEALDLHISDSRLIDEATGTEAFWLVNGDPEQIKRDLETIEDSFPAARLFDFDLLVRDPGEQNGSQASLRKLSRAVPRSCIICGAPAAECARSRRHGLDAVRAETGRLLKAFCAETLADAAVSSLLEELYTTPKPGLVDLANCGAHTDMDVPLFEKSAESLRSYFRDAAILGMGSCSMKELRERGVAAEQEMFRSTGGVNTHKGMIYSMGLLVAGMGKVLAESDCPERADEDADAAVRYAAELAREDAERQLGRSLADPETNGGHVLKTFGAAGATGEAAAGFPDALYCASRLGYYRESEETNGTGSVNAAYKTVYNKAGALAFCDSLMRLEDTNLLHRGGREGLDFVRSEAARIAETAGCDERISELESLDAEMIRRRLSPGGSADMLALAYLIESWRAVMNWDPAGGLG